MSQHHGDRYNLDIDCEGYYAVEVTKRLYEMWVHFNSMPIDLNNWVTADLLSASCGLKIGTIDRARKNKWMLGREYVHISPSGPPKKTNECLYSRKAVDAWVESQVKKQPRD